MAYRTAATAEDEYEALSKAVRRLTEWYSSVVAAGHEPSDDWLVKGVRL